MTDPERFIAEALQGAGGEAVSERVTAAFADERIAEKIARLKEPREREGLDALNRTLRDREVPPGVRLHLVSAVAHLGRIAGESLPERQRATRKP